MNFFCNHCGRSFSVGVEQFGTRGKCPHCRATLVIPRLMQSQADPTTITPAPPWRWMDRTLAGLIALVVHLFALAVMALAPWHYDRAGLAGQGEEIQLGILPQIVELAPPSDTWQAEQVAMQDRSDHHAQSTNDWLTDRLAQQGTWSLEHAPSASSGAWNPRAESQEWLPRSSLPAGARDEFGMLISRLQADGLDLVIVFDSTASMDREIDQVKWQIERIATALLQLIPKTRIGLCTYRDHGDEYVVKGLPLTDDVGRLVSFLETVRAAGGGDEPEAVDEGLAWAIENNDFRRQARKIILLFGDAPPHANRQLQALQWASDFRRRGGIISTVTCRKAEPLPSFVEISQLGGGEAFLSRDERQIVTQLVVLVFGSQHRDKVVEIFKLLEP